MGASYVKMGGKTKNRPPILTLAPFITLRIIHGGKSVPRFFRKLFKMETKNKNKGGRPKKELVRNHCLRVACDKNELQTIKTKAAQLQLTISEYLRKLGVDSHIDIKQKRVLPKEVLLFTAQLNHLAANINSLSHKNNRGENFNQMEKDGLRLLSQEIQKLANDIKIFIR